MVKRARGSLLLSIKFDRNSHQPISTQLYVAMRELILAGGFLAGERLPATRTLAKDLGISRTTVIEVFDRLTSESLVTSKTGAGTYVSKALSAERPKHLASQTKIQNQRDPQLSRLMGQAFLRFSDRKRLPHAPRAFTTALPAFDFFQWRSGPDFQPNTCVALATTSWGMATPTAPHNYVAPSPLICELTEVSLASLSKFSL